MLVAERRKSKTIERVAGGGADGQRVLFDSDGGAYVEGQRYLLFLKKQPDTEIFYLVNDEGRYAVDEHERLVPAARDGKVAQTLRNRALPAVRTQLQDALRARQTRRRLFAPPGRIGEEDLMSRARLALSFIALFAFTFGAGVLSAAHRWGCWKYADHIIYWYNGGTGEYYDIYNEEALTDADSWHNYTNIDLVPVGSPGTTDHINAYNGYYGYTGWLGIAEIVGSSGCIVQNGRARLNQTYLDDGSYTRTNKSHVACQEVGHLFGLHHNNNSNASCMNDWILSAPQPDAHDRELINSIYPVSGGGSAGNPFQYANGRDEFLACYGIAGSISSNCRDISDYNDKQLCYAMSQRSQSPCTSITDRNLQLACYGMSINWPSNCRDITDSDMRNFCYGESYQDYNYCSSIADRNTQLLCFAMSSGVSSYCQDISNANDREFCYGVSSHNNAYCANISQ